MKLNKLFHELVWLTQLGFSLLTPPMLCLGLAWWCIDKFSAPLWIMLPAFILGFGAAGTSFWQFYKYTQRKADKHSKEGPPAFNDHT